LARNPRVAGVAREKGKGTVGSPGRRVLGDP